MTQVLPPDGARELRLLGLKAMLEGLAAYDAAGQTALVVVYPGGGWALLDPDGFDADSELRLHAQRMYEDHCKRRAP